MKLRPEFFTACVLLLAVSAWAQSVQTSDENSTLLSCECFNKHCGCCEHLGWSYIGINGTLCSNASYLSQDYGISVTITYNTYTIFNETISARNPPPICVGIPKLEQIRADVCVRFYDLSFGDEHFHGCAKAIISVYHMIHKSVNLGCWNTPAKLLPGTPIDNSGQIAKKEREGLAQLSNEIPNVKMI